MAMSWWSASGSGGVDVGGGGGGGCEGSVVRGSTGVCHCMTAGWASAPDGVACKCCAIASGGFGGVLMRADRRTVGSMLSGGISGDWCDVGFLVSFGSVWCGFCVTTSGGGLFGRRIGCSSV